MKLLNEKLFDLYVLNQFSFKDLVLFLPFCLGFWGFVRVLLFHKSNVLSSFRIPVACKVCVLVFMSFQTLQSPRLKEKFAAFMWTANTLVILLGARHFVGFDMPVADTEGVPSLFVCLFCCFTSQVYSYGHCGTVSSPNHTFSWASLNKQLTSTSCTYFRL